MAKPDFPALLAPGMHKLSLQDVYDLAVSPFPGDVQRDTLYQRLSKWCGALQGCGVRATMWLDGSFLTQKPGPGDIDCVVWSPAWISPANNTLANRSLVDRLFDHAMAESLFSLDLYVEYPTALEIFHREAYWRGVLGFGHDRLSAKGFAEVSL